MAATCVVTAIEKRRPLFGHSVSSWNPDVGLDAHLRITWWAASHLVAVIDFMMQRKQLLGIARRAEEPRHAVPKNGRMWHEDAIARNTLSSEVPHGDSR